MDEDKIEAATATDKEMVEEVSAATTNETVEVPSITTTGDDPAAPASSAAEEAPAAPKEDDDKPSEKEEDVKMEDAAADEPQSANGDHGGTADGTTKEAEATAEKDDKADDAETKDEPAVAAAKSPGKSSTRKKRAAPASPASAAALSSPSPAAAGATGAESGGGGREKRARKTLVAYAPEDFTKVDRSVQIHPGRGLKIGSLKAVRASVEASKDHALAELAHKLLYGGNKKPVKDAVKGNILEFSGYLPPKPKDVTPKELEAMDKKLEVRWGVSCHVGSRGVLIRAHD
jgi:hypothetical protein